MNPRAILGAAVICHSPPGCKSKHPLSVLGTQSQIQALLSVGHLILALFEFFYSSMAGFNEEVVINDKIETGDYKSQELPAIPSSYKLHEKNYLNWSHS